MTPLHVIYGGERGFWSRSNQWTTVLTDAKTMSEADAVAFCRRRKGASALDGAVSAMPVSYDLALEVISP